MKSSYKATVSLRCFTCGGTDFYYNDDKSYIKCNQCDREYLRGYDELVELNKSQINGAFEHKKREILNDVKQDFEKALKDAFRGNKHIKFK